LGINPVLYDNAELKDEDLQYAAQFGATDVILQSYGGGGIIPGDTKWELEDIIKTKKRVERYGLNLLAFENVPTRFYEHIMLGGPKREEQVQNMIYTIRNIARAGVGIFGYNWMPSLVWRTNRREPIRSGALSTAFDYSHPMVTTAKLTHERKYSEEEMWQNLEYWIKIITPIAEQEHIRLGIHPCDPPVPELGGIPQLLRSFASYKRLIQIFPSDSNAVEFCQGSFSEMQGDDIYEMIEYFGTRNKILYVHFRNVDGHVPKFKEEFVNTGYVDMYKAMKLYHKLGFKGVFVDDHVPETVGDSAWCHRGRAFANGYMQGLIEAVTKQ